MKDTALGYSNEDEIEAIIKANRNDDAIRLTSTTCKIGHCIECISRSIAAIEKAVEE